MSLINSMLLELDARQEQHYGFDNSVINSEVKPVAVSRRRRQNIKIICLGLAIVIAAAFGLTYFPLPKPQSAVTANPAVDVRQTGTGIATIDSGNNTARPVPPADKVDEAPANNNPATSARNMVMPDDNQKRKSQSHTRAVATPHTSQAAPRADREIAAKEISPTASVATHSVQRKQHLPDDQQTANNHYATALRYYKQGRLSESIEMLYQALQLDPGHVKSREVLSGILMQHQRWPEAEKVLRDGIKMDPQQQPGLNQLMARLKVEQGFDDQAITILEEQFQQGYTSADSSALLAQLYQRQGRHESASRYYKQALIAQPDHGRWWLGLAISLEAQHQLTDAAKAYRLAANSQLEPQLLEYARQRQQAISSQLDSP